MGRWALILKAGVCVRWGHVRGDPEVSELQFPRIDVFIFICGTGRLSELPSSLHYSGFFFFFDTATGSLHYLSQSALTQLPGNVFRWNH